MWPNRRVECPTCRTVFRECGDEGSRVLRKLGSVDDVTQAVILQQSKEQT